MNGVEVRPHIAFAPVDPLDPTLQAWVRTLKARNPHFAHAHDSGPGTWLGLYGNESLLSAIGYTWNADNSVLIEYIVCRPSRAGRWALFAIMLTLKKILKGRRIVWFTQNDNPRMKRLYHILGATPVATMYELQEA
jgi:hypothetical protein